MSALPKFNRKARCPKCGSAGIHTVHMAPEEFRSVYECGRKESREHMHRSCRGCCFSWDEAPLDARGARIHGDREP